LPEPERAHEEQLRVENNSTQLPDCRVYELVSPAGKTGGIADVLAREYPGQYFKPMQASPEGAAITYSAEAFSPAHAGAVDQYVSVRTSSGWSTTNVSPPEQPNGGPPETVGASMSLSAFLLASGQGTRLTSGAPEGYSNIYLANRSQALTPLITQTPPARTPETFGQAQAGVPRQLVFVPASEDFSQVYFGANAMLTEDAPAGGIDENNLYRWAADKLRLVNVLPNGTAEPGATFGGEYRQFHAFGSTIPDLDHAVSADGLRAFWTDENNHNLYLRETYFEAGEERERTVLVGEDAKFLSADKEGTKVFFADENKLTGDSTAASGEPDLYECELVGPPGSSTCSVKDLTVDHKAGEHANVQGIVGLSEEGDYVYFVADGVLALGASTGDCVFGEFATTTTCSLYLDHNGVISFISTLSGHDNQPNSSFEAGEETEEIADWTPEIWARQAEVSPNGQFVAFGSHLPLTGQVNNGPEIFVYDVSTHVLSCASCSPDGTSNNGAELPSFGDSYGLYEPRYMLNNGRLFFTTASALVPQDVNGQKDVYEWIDGELHLISSGTSPGSSVFADASEDGSNVFFTTSQALVPEDKDEIVDMYDAREDGGFAAPTVTRCESINECHSGAPAPLLFENPPSAIFLGGGNLAPVPPVSAAPVDHALTRAQKLARALKACHKRRIRKLRVLCEAQARRQYAVPTKKTGHGTEGHRRKANDG
jgi:hypothetical protein